MDLVTPIGLGQRGLIVAPLKLVKRHYLKKLQMQLVQINQMLNYLYY